MMKKGISDEDLDLLPAPTMFQPSAALRAWRASPSGRGGDGDETRGPHRHLPFLNKLGGAQGDAPTPPERGKEKESPREETSGKGERAEVEIPLRTTASLTQKAADGKLDKNRWAAIRDRANHPDPQPPAEE